MSKCAETTAVFSRLNLPALAALVFIAALQTGCNSEKGPVSLVEIRTSSNMFPEDERFSPRFLMEEQKTIWHAQSPPRFPEWIEIAYSGKTKKTHLEIMAQDDSPGGNEHTRGPKDFVVQGSNDGVKWKDLLHVTNNVYTKSGEWKDWDFDNGDGFSRYRIYITAGNDEGLLTIRQIKLQ